MTNTEAGRLSITLTASEQSIAHTIARARHAYNRSAGHANTAIADIHTIDLDGAGAELAFCRLINAYPPIDDTGETHLETGTHPVADCVLSGGTTVDVKTTKYETGLLLIPAAKVDAGAVCDVYALMVGSFPTYRLAGYIGKESAFNEHRRKRAPRGVVNYIVPQEDLSTNISGVNAREKVLAIAQQGAK